MLDSFTLQEVIGKRGVKKDAHEVLILCLCSVVLKAGSRKTASVSL